MADIRQAERQIHILSILSESKQGDTVQELHHSLQKLGIDVSRKTIERDIDNISKHFYVYEEEGSKETRYRADKLKIDNITFTLSELLSLYFLQQVIKPYQKLDVGKTASSPIEKILERAPSIHRLLLIPFQIGSRKPGGCYSGEKLDENYIQTAREALRRNTG